MLNTLRKWFTQLSTWEGIAAVSGAIGITIYPAAALEIVSGVFVIIGGIQMWRDESEKE